MSKPVNGVSERSKRFEAERYGSDLAARINKRSKRHSGPLTRSDTRLPKSRAGGQGPYLRSPDHLDRISEVKEIKS